MYVVKAEYENDKYFHNKENAIAKVEKLLKEELGNRNGDTPEDFGYNSWREMAEAGGAEDVGEWFKIEFEDEPKPEREPHQSWLGETRGIKMKTDLQKFIDMLDNADIDYLISDIGKYGKGKSVEIGDNAFLFNEDGMCFACADC